jgi:exopolyphosphatase/pppGpp-phosphohydrolase
MAAGASLIEAALDCYNLESLEASDASLREGIVFARAQAGEAWRDDLVGLVSGLAAGS